MKKILLIICAAMMSIGVANAQVEKGNIAVGAALLYGSEINNIGLGARVHYTPISHLRGELSLNYFFEKNYLSMWDINLNAQYLVGLWRERLYIYPIVGLSFARLNANKDKFFKDHGTELKRENDKAFGLNLGAGIEFELTERWGLSLEYRHSIMKHIDQGVFALGANFKF
ncbi:MAG: porin family protein [Muribaculaceae bacterium]|nr:porin family protein [Muribaculaceae bacterium]